MRRIFVSFITAILALSIIPISASANTGAPTAWQLVNSYHRALMGTTESDPWIFDDGCTGGSSAHDPAFMLVPIVDPPVAESSCSVRAGAPVVVVPAGVTCWLPTLKAAREECETIWNDESQILVKASVKVDGKAKKLYEFTVSGGFTFPEGAALDVPGTKVKYYGISEAVILRDLKPGVHTVKVAFEYADGFAGATTFKLVVKPKSGS